MTGGSNSFQSVPVDAAAVDARPVSVAGAVAVVASYELPLLHEWTQRPGCCGRIPRDSRPVPAAAADTVLVRRSHLPVDVGLLASSRCAVGFQRSLSVPPLIPC